MTRLFTSIAMGVIRHLLTAGGGALLGQGLIDKDQDTQLIAAAMTIIGIAWSAYQKYGQHKTAINPPQTDLIAKAASQARGYVQVEPLPPIGKGA